MAISRKRGKVRGKIIPKDSHNKREAVSLCTKIIRVLGLIGKNSVAKQRTSTKATRTEGTTTQPRTH